MCQQGKSKKARIQCVAAPASKSLGENVQGGSDGRKLTKKQEATLERRRVSLEKATQKQIAAAIAEKQKAQIASIMQECRLDAR